LHLTYPRAIFFDLDDTILALNKSVNKCWQIVCKSFASQVDLGPEKLLAAIDKTRTWYWGDPDRHREGRLKLYAARREMVNLALQSLGINDTTAADSLADAYGVEMEKHMVPFPGARETLEHLKRGKVLLALLTNGASEIQRRKIDRFNLAPFFNIILVEEEMGFGKPDERVFLKALHHFGLSPDQAWMVGDDLERDIDGAQKAGIFSWWVDSKDGFSSRASEIKPDRTIKAIRELL